MKESSRAFFVDLGSTRMPLDKHQLMRASNVQMKNHLRPGLVMLVNVVGVSLAWKMWATKKQVQIATFVLQVDSKMKIFLGHANFVLRTHSIKMMGKQDLRMTMKQTAPRAMSLNLEVSRFQVHSSVLNVHQGKERSVPPME
jgi:hypothetical protein